MATFDALRAFGPSGALALGDFNGDGLPDVAMGSYSPNPNQIPTTTVSIWLGAGNGHLRLGQTYTVGPNPGPIVVGDFNGDGKLDLALGTYDATTNRGNILVLLGNGDGTFRPPVVTALGINVSAYGLTAVDLNGDGKLDLTMASGGSELAILLGNGDGTFTMGTPLFPGYTVFSTVSGDFNGDGKPDLAVVAQATFHTAYVNLYVYLGNGDGTFQSPVSYGIGYGTPSAVVGDFNRDGKLDLAVTVPPDPFGSGSVGTMLGNGDGTFQPPVLYPAGGSPGSIAVADLNGDGKLDLVVGNGDEVAVLLGNGDGTFKPPSGFVPGGVSVFLADFNGDRKLDVLAANATFSILLGKGDGTFRQDLTFNAGQDPSSVVVGDFNRDGNADLAVTDFTQKSLSILLGNGHGFFGAAKHVAVDKHATSLISGDFNGDGKLDLAVVISEYKLGLVSVLLGNGDGTFLPAVNYSVGNGVNGIPINLTVGDFNGDGKLDLATISQTALSILFGNGDGTFQPAVTRGPGGYALTVGDFNADGKQDVAITNYLSSGAVLMLLGNGDGTFQQPVSYPVEKYPSAVVTGDFNGDGKLDLAVGNSDSTAFPGAVSILLGNGDGTFQPTVGYASGGLASTSLAVGDFNGDGKPDLAVAGYYTDDVSILLGKGDGTFFLELSYAVASAPASVAVGYFDQYRKPDLAVVGNSLSQGTPTGAHTLTVLLNSTP